MLYVQSLHVCHNCIMACCMYSLSMYVITVLWHAVCTVSPCMSQLKYGMLYVQSLHVCHNCIMACCMYSLSMYVITVLWHAVCNICIHNMQNILLGIKYPFSIRQYRAMNNTPTYLQGCQNSSASPRDCPGI